MTDDLQDLFAARRLRCTRQRAAIFEVLAQSRAHPTADDLYHQVTTTGQAAGISLATVYNALEAFCTAGLAQKLPGAGDNGSARYDAVSDNHLHTRCERTGAVADVPVDLGRRILERIPDEVVREVESRLGFKVNQVHIELVGEPQQ